MKINRVCGLTVTLLLALLYSRASAYHSFLPIPVRMQRGARDNVLDEQLRKYFAGKWWWETDDKDKKNDDTDKNTEPEKSDTEDKGKYGGDEDKMDHGSNENDKQDSDDKEEDVPISGGGDHDY